MMNSLSRKNPFNAKQGDAVHAESVQLGKELLQEVRREDALMADDLIALAPRSGRAFRPLGSQEGSAAGESVLSKSAAASAARGGRAGYAVDVHDTLTTSDFVQQKREVGLVRMSLTTKKAEIRKLEEKLDRAEKRLRQQQEQLANTREKFNNFLKFSNLEQDAAVRRADDETRAKHAKTVEIKKLSALINHAEMEMRKTRIQIENCVAYKEFLESLAKPQWFYDVLSNFRIEDKTEKILMETEEIYQKRCEKLKLDEEVRQEAERRAAEEELQLQQQQSAVPLRGTRRSVSVKVRHSVSYSPHQRGSGLAAAEPEKKQTVPLEQQLEDLYIAMDEEARDTIAAASASIRAEVGAMSLAAVKQELHNSYDEKRLPLCFATVDELLEVFINVEEGNLFLIQNCHELEEELESVSMGFLQEREEMNAMVSQRTAQLEALVKSVGEAQQKMKALDDRMASLESRVGPQPGGTTGSGGAASKRGTSTTRSGGAGAGDGGGVSISEMTPEELKKKVEESIIHMFNLLRTGDQQLKTASQNLNALKAEDGSEVPHSTARPSSRRASATLRASKVSTMIGMGTEGRKGASTTGGAGGSPLLDSSRRTARKQQSIKGSIAGASAVVASHATSHQQHQDASMGPVEMLTIVENKLEEYHRYLNDATHHVELTLVQSVMKQSDKQRRRQARLVHLACQEEEQEERIRRALERSQAPIIHKCGKPIHPRSFVKKPVDEKSQRKAERAAAALDGSRTSIDSDEDGAEFFR